MMVSEAPSSSEKQEPTPASATTAFTFETAVYDLELVASSNVERVVEGRVKLDKSVSS